MIPPGIEIWAQAGIESLLTPEVRDPHPFSIEEVAALLRAAYGKGYVAALTEEPPLTILEAGRRTDALRVALPIE